ncbi:WD40 repeat-containing protein SMU1 [Plasmodiophora brassicae]
MQPTLSDKQEELDKLLSNVVEVDLRCKRIDPKGETFDPADARIKRDVMRLIIQYLRDEGYMASMLTVQDETNVKIAESAQRRARIRRLQSSICAGEWSEVESLCQKIPFSLSKCLLYATYKQQYLELIDRQEYQKAFSFLTKYLKPFEATADAKEFADLCYLLTCRSVQEAHSFKDWLGVAASRDRLAEQFEAILQSEVDTIRSCDDVPAGRLVELLQQAVAYQIEFSRYHPKLKTRVTSLLSDHCNFLLPNVVRNTFIGHESNVKGIDFVGEESRHIVSGSSDNTIKIWDTETAHCLSTFQGHTSRVWDVASNVFGTMVASCSGDSTVKVWDTRPSALEAASSNSLLTLAGHEGDVYSVKFHPNNAHLVTGAYDRTARLFDLETGSNTVTFRDHQSSIASVVFNPYGNLVVSGSKDNSIKFWDILSGVCIKTYSLLLGEVTSVAMNASGTQLLSCSKDNSNRIWDIRVGRPFQRLKGHQNTSKNFVRAEFGPSQNLVAGGSDDARVYIWDIESGELVQRLPGHKGAVFSARCIQQQSVLATCSQDATIKTWTFDPDQAHFV